MGRYRRALIDAGIRPSPQHWDDYTAEEKAAILKEAIDGNYGKSVLEDYVTSKLPEQAKKDILVRKLKHLANDKIRINPSKWVE